MSNSSNKTIAKNTIFLIIRMVIVTFITIFTTRFLLQNLGIEDYGVYNVTLGIVAICSFLRPSLANAVQRFYNVELGKNSLQGATRVFSTGLFIHFCIALLLVVICELLGLWYINTTMVIPDGRYDAVFWVFQISMVSMFFSMIQVPYTAAVMAHEKMDFFAALNVIDAVLKLLIAILICYSPFDRLVFYGFLLLCVTFFNLVINAWYAHHNFKEAYFSKDGIRDLLRPLLSFSFWNMFESLARIGKDQGSNMLLNYYFGPAVNAARGVTGQVSFALASLIDTSGTAARPQMVQRFAKGEVESSISIFYSLSKVVAIVVILIGVPIFLETNYVLHLWLGDNIPSYSIVFVRLVIIMTFVDKLATPVTSIIHATGKIKKYHLTASIINLLVMPLVWLFFSMDYDAEYLYISFILGSFVAQALFVRILNKQVCISKSKYLIDVIAKPLLTLLMAAILPVYLHYSMEEGFMRLVAVSCAMLLMMAPIGYTICLSKSEKGLIRSFLAKFKK